MSKSTSSYLKIGVFAALLIAIDQITKYIATINLKGKMDFTIIKDVLELHYLDGGNTGAAWGMFSGKRVIFIAFTCIATLLIGIFIKNVEKLKNNYSLKSTKLIVLQYAFGALIAGALGNLIDRVVYGYVTDFIYFKLINFPIFNVADCYVTVSCVIILLICLLKTSEGEFNKIFALKSKTS